MMMARDVMTRSLITVTVDTEISEAAGILLENHINGVPVLDRDGNLTGILCQSDIIVQQKRLPVPFLFSFLDGYIPLTSIKTMEKEARKIAATSVAHAMTPNPVRVDPESSIETVASLMVDNNFHTLPVVEDGKLVGIIGKEDVLRTLIPEDKKASES